MSTSSGPIMSTGDTAFDTKKKKQGTMGSGDAVMHIALLGDFSGRTNSGLCDRASIGKRKAIDIDRDNFDEVFSALNVSLHLPSLSDPITFAEFDDLHPDFLFEKLAVFERFRTLKRRLRNPSLFQAAADEIRAFSKNEDKEGAHDSPLEVNEGDIQGTGNIELTPSTLDTLFAQTLDSTSAIAATSDSTLLGDSDIDRMIRGIVSPYVEQKGDPDLPSLLCAVDDACSETMRKILHASAFQRLESSWLSVYNLVRRLVTNRTLKLFLIDISKEEILTDIEMIQTSGGNLEQSQLYKLLIESRASLGGTPFSLINADFYVSDDTKDLALASTLSTIAWVNNGTALLGADPKLAGCEAIERSVDPDDWQYSLADDFVAQWKALSMRSESEHIALIAPRTLLRLPYGAKTSPIESFDFEELASPGDHSSYCWGNSSYSVTFLLAESFSRYQWNFRPGQVQEIENLPLHVYRDEDDESQIKSCGEALLTDSGAGRLGEEGLLSVRSVRGKASIIVADFGCLAANAKLQGQWNG